MIISVLNRFQQVSKYRKRKREYVKDSLVQSLCVCARVFLCACRCTDLVCACYLNASVFSAVELWRAVPIQVPAALPHEHSHRTQAVHVPMVWQRLQHETVFWWAHENTHRWEKTRFALQLHWNSETDCGSVCLCSIVALFKPQEHLGISVTFS